MATVARLCARPALRVAAEEMETEAAMEADILAWWERSSGRLVRGLARGSNRRGEQDLLGRNLHREFRGAQAISQSATSYG